MQINFKNILAGVGGLATLMLIVALGIFSNASNEQSQVYIDQNNTQESFVEFSEDPSLCSPQKLTFIGYYNGPTKNYTYFVEDQSKGWKFSVSDENKVVLQTRSGNYSYIDLPGEFLDKENDFLTGIFYDSEKFILYVRNRDGKVSMYKLELNCGIIKIVKNIVNEKGQPLSPQSKQGFNFQGSFSTYFTLYDDGSPVNDTTPNKKEFYLTRDGTRTFAEFPLPFGWEIYSISCISKDKKSTYTIDASKGLVSINLIVPDVVTCTFKNKQSPINAKLNIIKEWDPNEIARAFDFTIKKDSSSEEKFKLFDNGKDPKSKIFNISSSSNYDIFEDFDPVGDIEVSHQCLDQSGQVIIPKTKGGLVRLEEKKINISANISCTFYNTCKQNDWIEKNGVGKDIPDGEIFGNIFGAGFVIDDNLYFGGGFGNDLFPNKNFYKYNSKTNTWVKISDFPFIDADKDGKAEGLAASATFSVNGKGYIVGGFASENWLGKQGTLLGRYDNYKNSVNYVFEYDPENDKWTQKKDFAGTARGGAIGFAIEGNGYVGTGQYYNKTDGNGFYAVNDFWSYDPINDVWTKKKDFANGSPYSQRAWAFGFVVDGKGYIGTGMSVPGKKARPGIPTKDFWMYDITANNWIQKADYATPEEPNGINMAYGFGFSVGDRGYAGGGSINDFWSYDPSFGVLGIWTKKERLKSNTGSGFGIRDKGYLITRQDFLTEEQEKSGEKKANRLFEWKYLCN